MKTSFLAITLILVNIFLSSAMAASLKVGTYSGETTDGRECYVKVSSSRIDAGYRDGARNIWSAQSASRSTNNESLEGNVYKHRSSADGSRLVIDAELDNKGAITTAKINIGFTGWIGKTCKMK